MTFVGDKLYNGYLRKNMAAIVSRVKPIEIMVHLPCLTAHDREVIQAKTETRGKFDGMVCLLDCLKRRERWPEQLIEALEACEHVNMAAEIRAEYDALMGLHDSSSSSPPANVIRAHVHPAPSNPPVQLPGTTAVTRPAEAPPAPEAPAAPEASEAPKSEAVEAPPAPAAPASPEASEAPKSEAVEVPAAAAVPEAPSAEAQKAEAPASPETPEAEAAEAPAAAAAPEAPSAEAPAAVQTPPSVSLPELVLEPLQAAQTEVPPPPSTPPPSPETPHQQETPDPHRQPEENSELDIQEDLPEGNQEQPQPGPDPPHSSSVVTPEKLPVQDTTPPMETTPLTETTPPSDKVPTQVLQSGDTSDPSTEQVAERSPQPETSPDESVRSLTVQDDHSVCLSKPQQLVSIHPQDPSCSTLPAASGPIQPYSGSSDRLEMSQAEPDQVPTGTAPPCQENGFAPSPLEPEENHYDSPTSSLALQEVLVNVVQVTEEASILNLDAQTTTSHTHINGDVAKDANDTKDVTTTPDPPASCDAPEPQQAESAQGPEDKAAPQTRSTESVSVPQAWITESANTTYVLTAAGVGVGVCALLVAWRLRN